jgi:hypothetical protein
MSHEDVILPDILLPLHISVQLSLPLSAEARAADTSVFVFPNAIFISLAVY